MDSSVNHLEVRHPKILTRDQSSKTLSDSGQISDCSTLPARLDAESSSCARLPQPFTHNLRALGIRRFKLRKWNIYKSNMAGYLQFYMAQLDIIIHIVEVKKMMVREVEQLAQSHPASQ